MLFNFSTLNKRIKRERQSAVRRNPPQAPREYIELLDGISQWARAGLAQNADVQFNSGNAKMNKTVQDSPVSTNQKLSKSRGKWITQGVALMPANTLQRYFKNADGTVNRDLLQRFSLTAEDVQRFSNACPAATKGCMAVCLTDSGMMHMTPSKEAQIRRHLTFEKNREAFMITVAVGLAKAYASARKKGARLGIRLNVTSDIKWESIPLQVDVWLAKYLAQYGIKAKNGRPLAPGRYPNIMKAMPQIFFYDYTKVQPRMMKFMDDRSWPKNYHLVWSLAEIPANRLIAIEVLQRRKSTVSTAFDIPSRKIKKTGKHHPLPETLTIVDNTVSPQVAYTFPVNDADEHDMRALDDPGAIAGLRFKIPGGSGGMAKAIAAAKGFVIKTEGSRHPIIYVREGRFRR